MKSFAVFSTILAVSAALVSAAPAAKIAREFDVFITFKGAADGEFSMSFPTDGSLVEITNSLSVSKISSVGGGFCNFYGVNGSDTVVFGEETVDVGPPQTQVSGSCSPA